MSNKQENQEPLQETRLERVTRHFAGRFHEECGGEIKVMVLSEYDTSMTVDLRCIECDTKIASAVVGFQA